MIFYALMGTMDSSNILFKEMETILLRLTCYRSRVTGRALG